MAKDHGNKQDIAATKTVIGQAELMGYEHN